MCRVSISWLASFSTSCLRSMPSLHSACSSQSTVRFITRRGPKTYAMVPDTVPSVSSHWVLGRTVLFQKKKNITRAEADESQSDRPWAVDTALYLLVQCLQVIDPGLYHHLKKHNASPYLYAQCIAPLSDCSPSSLSSSSCF